MSSPVEDVLREPIGMHEFSYLPMLRTEFAEELRFLRDSVQGQGNSIKFFKRLLESIYGLGIYIPIHF